MRILSAQEGPSKWPTEPSAEVPERRPIVCYRCKLPHHKDSEYTAKLRDSRIQENSSAYRRVKTESKTILKRMKLQNRVYVLNYEV